MKNVARLIVANARERKSPSGTSGFGRRGHQDREEHERDHPDDDGDPGGRVGPLVRLAADEAERETADGERRDDRAEPVEPAGRLGVPRLLDVGQRRPQREREQRDVDQEREPPADGVDEDPADDRPEDGQRRGRRGPDAERAAARRALEGVGDERERAGDEQGAGGALEQPEEDQPARGSAPARTARR